MVGIVGLRAYGVSSRLILPAPVRVERQRLGWSSRSWMRMPPRPCDTASSAISRFRGLEKWVGCESGERGGGVSTGGAQSLGGAYSEGEVLASSDSRRKAEMSADFGLTTRRGSYFRVRVIEACGWAWDDVAGHGAAFIICRTPSLRTGIGGGTQER